MGITKKANELVEKLREYILDRMNKVYKISKMLEVQRKNSDISRDKIDLGGDDWGTTSESLYSAVLETIDYSGRVLERTNKARVNTEKIKKIYAESVKKGGRLLRNYHTYSHDDDVDEEIASMFFQISVELMYVNKLASFLSPYLSAVLMLIISYLLVCSLHPSMFDRVNDITYYINWVLTRNGSSFNKLRTYVGTQDFKRALDEASRLAALYVATETNDHLIDPFLSSLISDN